MPSLPSRAFLTKSESSPSKASKNLAFFSSCVT